MPQKNLTETFAGQVRATKRTYFWDRRIPGFGMRVSAKGRRTWLFRYRTAAGDQHELKLGLYPSVTANAAREQAMQLAARVHQGDDPALGVAPKKWTPSSYRDRGFLLETVTE